MPIVRRGKDWANGQVLKDVARVAGIKWGGAKILPAPELVARLITIQQAAQRFFAQIPDDKLGQQLPNRPRSYAQLAYHIFNIADAWLEHEVQGLPLKEGAYNRVPPPRDEDQGAGPGLRARRAVGRSRRGGAAPARAPTSAPRPTSTTAT